MTDFNRCKKLFHKVIKSVYQDGLGVTWQKSITVIKRKMNLSPCHTRLFYDAKELKMQRDAKFQRDVKFSILVPLYNTPEKFLVEMIESVLAQTYSNWELCLADGSNLEHTDVERTCCKYVGKDRRIKYQKLDKNMGISCNTNACAEMASGDYICLLDHDDVLSPAALYENMKIICNSDVDVVYSDEATFKLKIKLAYCPNFKPDYSPDTLRSYNYICHFLVIERSLFKRVEGFKSEFDGSQDYDLILRLTEVARNIVHIPRILYFWRASENSTALDVAAKPYTMTAAKRAITEHLKRIGLKGLVVDSRIPTTYRVNYEISGDPLVSIIIPSSDHVDDLRKCVNSIIIKTTYKNYEIIIIDNNSKETRTFEYYNELRNNAKTNIITWEKEFNFSSINNFAFKHARGKYVLFLNNDTEVISNNWIEEMLMFAQREDVGAVGCMLYYPDNTIQHAGVVLGIGGVAGHIHKNFKRNEYGYMSRAAIAQNLSAVTAACMMVPRHVFEEIGGFDEGYRIAFNDVDFCMRIRKAGYLIVFTPYAELYHYESKSRGYEDTSEKKARFASEVNRFLKQWHKELNAGDPYYNPNLTLDREDFSLK